MAKSNPNSPARRQTFLRLLTARSHSTFRCSGATSRAFPTAEYIGPATKPAPSSLAISRQESR